MIKIEDLKVGLSVRRVQSGVSFKITRIRGNGLVKPGDLVFMTSSHGHDRVITAQALSQKFEVETP